LEPGDGLIFHVVVFGRALEHVVDLLTAFHEVHWLGTRNGHVSLTEFASVQPCEQSQARVSEPVQVIWSSSSRGYRRPRWTTAGEIMSRAGGGALEVEFLTPTRLKHEAAPVETPEFHILFRNLLRRVSNLAYLHEGIDLKLDFAGLIQAARSVDLAARETTWIDWERLSRRQDRLMTLGGFVGPVRYRGDLFPFLPLLALGEYTHVGKNATFGLGQYRLGSGATPAGSARR
jgi:CRISPR-associated endoribonuclease Cas6